MNDIYELAAGYEEVEDDVDGAEEEEVHSDEEAEELTERQHAQAQAVHRARVHGTIYNRYGATYNQYDADYNHSDVIFNRADVI